LREELEEFELLVGEVQRSAADVDLVIVGIDGEIANLQDGGLVAMAGLACDQCEARGDLADRCVGQ
jgi:hypothetical protein